jgi:hypothetical protein
MRLIVGLVVAVFFLSGCTQDKGGKDGQKAPREVNPVFKLAAGAPQQYRVIYTQEMVIDVDGKVVSARRTYKTAFTLTHEGKAEEGFHAMINVDGLTAELITTDGSEAFDTGHIVGKHLDATLDRRGGAPGYAGSLPALDTGAITGGDVDVAFLFDYAFPRLPDEPVAVGNTWRVKSTRSQIEGTVPVTTEVSTTHQLAGFETVDGIDCLKIDTRSSAVLEGAMEDTVPPWTYKGTLRGRASWYFAVEEGYLVTLTLEEVTQGATTMGGAPSPTQQNTNVTVERIQ